MDFGTLHAHRREQEGKNRERENPLVMSPSREAYQKHLAEAFNMNRTQIFAFKNKAPTRRVQLVPNSILSRPPPKPNSSKPNRYIPQARGMNGRVVNNDVRVRHYIGESYRGHQQEVCGLRWSPSGQLLASGGNDNVIHIWDGAMVSSNSLTRWLHRFEEHRAAVKALA
ncbi:hypothetical protein JHK82_044184 [Glycine max]|uniref:Cell division cycle 20.2, cofactor of APC complex n=1 Tax=Glycine soja TaxID=3848 RepID=A0A445GF76_GLYSO|nr:hypothetical protein JHK87_044367 [Glycine soja]KAG4951272.1 hypothetical protein JHK85_045139 [Glycine max]KAG5099132.1 hypothetical protein JHK82_044184 [Glycine max]KAG5107736.1 hypothetical protein JHK84_044643 [Glycine max]RZB59818.1 Cell division cycle 20.2, cofactor of APC complex [Glycine soja]